MTTLSELIREGKQHSVALTNRKGETLIELSLLWAVIVTLAAPQLLLVVLIGGLLELIDVEYDGKALKLDG